MKVRKAFGALALLMATAAGAAPDTPPGDPVALAPTSTFKVEVDGAVIPSALTFIGDPGLMIMGCNLRFPVLVATEDQTIRYVPQEYVARDEEGNVTLKGSPSDPICNYQVSSGQIIFQAEGRKIRLSPRPPLVGPQTLEAILEYSPDYAIRIKGYQPDPAAVSYLSKYSRKTDVVIFFGSWCGVCEAWVPRLIKALQAAGNDGIRTEFHAVPKSITTDPAARQKQVQGVPTIILVQEGREVGRLTGRPESGSLEAAVARILRTGAGI